MHTRRTYSWRLKVDTKIKKWLKAGMNIYGHYRETSTPRVNEYDGLIPVSYTHLRTREFKWFRPEIGPNSISHNNIKALYYDASKDIIWIGTHPVSYTHLIPDSPW